MKTENDRTIAAELAGNNGGFGALAWIELQMVNAIVAILAAILPLLSAYKRKAQELACKSNLGQMGTAEFMHADENVPLGYDGCFCRFMRWFC